VTTTSRHTLLATLACAAVAVFLMFARLGDDRMRNDEATYAMAADHARGLGRWVHLAVGDPPRDYLRKPPLYVWLTAATAPLFAADDHARYRAWSAAFGVACVAGTCALGAWFFSPSVGLLAGLALAANRRFLFDHGARAGVFDTALTLATLTAVALAWAMDSPRRATLKWSGVGACAGLAMLLKPLAGVPILLIVVGWRVVAARSVRTGPDGTGREGPHEYPLQVGRGHGARVPWSGILVAMLIATAIAAPWYAAQWARYGPRFTHEMFRRNLVDRATVGIDVEQNEGSLYYVASIATSSPAFAVALPAVVALAVAAVRRGHPARRPAAVVAGVTLAWLALFTASRGKAAHYAYPVYPMLAIAVAAAAVGMAQAAAARWPRAPRVGAAAVAMMFVVEVAWVYGRTLPRDTRPFAPWAVYQAVAPDAAAGRARVVFYPTPVPRKVQAQMQFYGMRMTAARVARTPDELRAIVADGRPTLVYAWRGAKGWRPEDDEAFRAHRYAPLSTSTDDVVVTALNFDPPTAPPRPAGVERDGR